MKMLVKKVPIFGSPVGQNVTESKAEKSRVLDT